MCRCINNGAPDFKIEPRNHRAISEGFNALEVAANQARIIAEMIKDREDMLREIKSLKSEIAFNISKISALKVELYQIQRGN